MVFFLTVAMIVSVLTLHPTMMTAKQLIRANVENRLLSMVIFVKTTKKIRFVYAKMGWLR